MEQQNTPTQRLIITTRESALALWQANFVKDRIREYYPKTEIDLLGTTTAGDQILDRPLAQIGGKGLFIKELEVAMQEKRADLAVHSLKDVPMVLPEGFTLAAVLKREDPRDAFVSPKFASLAELPAGAIVGTGSLRREVQLRERYPNLDIRPLRGNVNTRLKKLDEAQYDAIVLAAAGLIRLGLADRIRSFLSIEESLPAVGQGALAIECLTARDDLIVSLTPLIDPPTLIAVTAERAFSRALGGSCETPLAAHASFDDQGVLTLRGFVADQQGKEIIRGQLSSAAIRVREAQKLGEELAARFVARGVKRLLP
ncbi:MAG: hydroxymethylbilane synthase [Burkholderiales bacterium]|nr:hydroxymethylbilane synthase [Burkholderiales bacterium]